MAKQREATCPAGHSFTTRANPRVKLRCPECREWVLAPPVPDPWPGPAAKDTPIGRMPPAVSDAPEKLAPAGPAREDRPAGGIRVVKAAKTVAGARRSAPRPAVRPTERPPETLTPAQQAGRRGGLAPGILRRMGAQ